MAMTAMTMTTHDRQLMTAYALRHLCQMSQNGRLKMLPKHRKIIVYNDVFHHDIFLVFR